jgi:hypothetical protein
MKPGTRKGSKNVLPGNETTLLFHDLSLLIEQSKKAVVSHVNNAMAMLFWQIGGRINAHVLEHKRARYGEQIVITLSRQLVVAHYLLILTNPKRLSMGEEIKNELPIFQ